MQVRRVNAFTCNVAKVSINHELIHKRSQTKELNDFYKQHKIVYYLLLELKLTLFYSAYYKHCTKFNVLTTCILIRGPSASLNSIDFSLVSFWKNKNLIFIKQIKKKISIVCKKVTYVSELVLFTLQCKYQSNLF